MLKLEIGANIEQLRTKLHNVFDIYKKRDGGWNAICLSFVKSLTILFVRRSNSFSSRSFGAGSA